MWEALGPLKLLIFCALFAGLDSFVGLSNWIACRFKAPRRADFVLLLLVVLGGFSTAIWMREHIPQRQVVALINYVSAEALERGLAENLALSARLRAEGEQSKALAPYVRVVAAVGAIIALVCLWLAWRQRRSLILWFPLAFLSSAGGVVWLIRNPLDGPHSRAMTAEALDTVRPA